MLAFAAGCAVFVLIVPRPVPPAGPPALVLDPERVGAQLAEDRRAAAEAPPTPEIDELWLEQGRAELVGNELRHMSEARAIRRKAAIDRLRLEHGPTLDGALRARACELLASALLGEHPNAAAFLGSFPRALRRYGALSDGELVAPWLTVRALWKARYNGLFDLPLTEGLSPMELRAYYGWLALRAASVPLEQRLAAVERWAEAGGDGALEARAALLYESGQAGAAADAYRAAYEATGSVRLRNHALAADVLSAAEGVRLYRQGPSP
jgi:hypothetical protein